MVAGDFVLKQILIFITVDGVLSQWPVEPSAVMMGGGMDMMGGGLGLEHGPLLGLEAGPMGGMGELPVGVMESVGGGMNNPGGPQGRNIPEYQEMPYHSRPMAARIAERQWNAMMNPQAVTEKPKKYKFPDGRPAQNGPNKNAWKNLKTSLDRTLTAFPNGLRGRPDPNQRRFQQNRAPNNARQPNGPHNQLRQQPPLPSPPMQQRYPNHMPRPANSNIQGRGFNNMRPVGPQTAPNVHQGRPGIPLKSNFPRRTFFTQPKPPGITPLPRNLAKGRPMLPSMIPQGGTVPVRQPLTMTSQNNAMQNGFVSQQARQMNTYPSALNSQQNAMLPSIQGISQANAKPLATVNRFTQTATQPGVYDTRGVKAPSLGYTPIISNTAQAPRKQPVIESMRKAVQNGEQIMGNFSRTVKSATPNTNTSTLDALTQAAEGPSLRNVNVEPTVTQSSVGVTNPPPINMYGATDAPFMDTYGTNSWGMGPTTSVYGSFYSSTGTMTQGLYDPYFATDVPHTLHYSHQSNLNIRQAGARHPIPTGQNHQRLLQHQERRQKQLQQERHQQQLMEHRQQYEKQYIAKQQQYMQAMRTTAAPIERPTAPPTTSAPMRRSEKVPVIVEMVTSTLTVPTQPPPTTTIPPPPPTTTTTTTTTPTTVTIPTTTKAIETTTLPATSTTQAPTQPSFTHVQTQQKTDPTRMPQPGIEDRMGVRPSNVDPNPDPNGPRPLPTQEIVQQTQTNPPSTPKTTNTVESQGTTILNNSTYSPLPTATTATLEPPTTTRKSSNTPDTNPSLGTPSTTPPSVPSTTQSPTSPPATTVVTEPPTTSNQGSSNVPVADSGNGAPPAEGQNSVVEKNQLSVPTSKPSLAEQQSLPSSAAMNVQQNGIQIEQDPRYEALPAYQMANAPRNQVGIQMGNSLTLSQNGPRYNLPERSSSISLSTQQRNYNNDGMLTVEQPQRFSTLNTVQRNRMSQPSVPYALQFSQTNSLLPQTTLSQSNVMRQNVRSAVQPHFTRGQMTMQQGNGPQPGFQGMNQNVPYQYPNMNQGLQVDTTVYQNPSQLGTQPRYPQMSQNLGQTGISGPHAMQNFAGQPSQMAFSGSTQRFAGQSMTHTGQWAGHRQVGPRGLSAQGHSKHSARLSNRPNPDMSVLTVKQKRGALFRSPSSSTANAKVGHLGLTLSKIKKNGIEPKVESLKQESESTNTTKTVDQQKDPKSTTTSTSEQTTTISTTVSTTENHQTTTYQPRVSHGNLVIIQKVPKSKHNSSVANTISRNEGHLDIIQKRIESSITPTTTQSPRDILTDSKQLSRRRHGQLYVAQRRRISTLSPRLRPLGASRNNAIKLPQRMTTNLQRIHNPRIASNMRPNPLQPTHLLAQRMRPRLSTGRMQMPKPSTFVQSRSTPTMNQLRGQIARRVRGSLLASGTAAPRRPQPTASVQVQRHLRAQPQRHLPRVQVQGQTQTRVQGQTQTRVQGQTQTRVQGQPQKRVQGQPQKRVQGQPQTRGVGQGLTPTMVQARAQASLNTQTKINVMHQRRGQTLPRTLAQHNRLARTRGMRQTLPTPQGPRPVHKTIQSAAVQRSPLKSIMATPQRQFSTPGVGLGMSMQTMRSGFRPTFAQTRIRTASGHVIQRGPPHRIHMTPTTNIRPGVFRSMGQ